MKTQQKEMTFEFPRYRMGFLWFLLLVMLAILCVRGWQLTQHNEMTDFKQLRDKTIKRQWVDVALRGNIYSDDNMLLAGNAVFHRVGFDPLRFHQYVKNAQKNNKTLAEAKEVLHSAQTILQSKVNLFDYAQKNPKRRYLTVIEKLTPEKHAKLAQLIKTHRINYFNIKDHYVRAYPNREVGAHVVGVINKSGRPILGAERWFNQQLLETSGKRETIWTGRSKERKYIGWKILEPAQHGETLQLTLDQRVQYLTHKALFNAYQKHQAKSASAIIIEAETGKLLSMVSLPTFNSNNPRNWKQAALTNHAIFDKVQPGSTVKPATMLAGLESEVIAISSTINANKLIFVEGYRVTDPRHFGVLDVAGILQKSSNIGAVKIGQKIGKVALWQMHKKLGWGRTNPLHAYSPPDILSIAHHDTWQNADFLSRTYGYGFTLDLLDLSRLYLAIANDGLIPTVHIWNQAMPETEQALVAKPSNVKLIRHAMTSVAKLGGTAPLAKVNGYTVAGKTGTVRHKRAGQYHYRAFFAGMVPAEDPKFVMIVMIEHDKEEERYYGGDSAAPVFGEVMPQLLRIYGVPPAKKVEPKIERQHAQLEPL